VTGNGHHFLLRTLTLLAVAAPLALAAGPASASASLSVINASLSSVSCSAANDCIAVGAVQEMRSGSFQFFPLAEHWNGSAWTVLPTPAPRHPGGGDLLSSVSCTSSTGCSPSNCMAVGDFIGIGNGMTLAEPWNGTSWKVVKTPRP
jgi:hypothetical protein